MKKNISLVVALYLVLLAVFFAPVIFQGKVIAPLDILDTLWRPWAVQESVGPHNAFIADCISATLPDEWSVYHSLREDGYIGWNPNMFNGAPILVNTILGPGDWHHQLYRFLPFWTAWDSGIIVQFTIAALGMMVLLLFLGIAPPYALIGMVAYGFYSQFFLWVYHRGVPGAMCWVPWVVWALLRAKSKGRVFDFLSIVFIALAFRGGTLQTSLFVFTAVVLLFLALAWEERGKLDSPTESEKNHLQLSTFNFQLIGRLFALFNFFVFRFKLRNRWFRGHLPPQRLLLRLHTLLLGNHRRHKLIFDP